MATRLVFRCLPPFPRNSVTPPVANSLPDKRRILWLLIAFALTIICLGSVVAMVIYADSHSSAESERRVWHSQQVLLSLEQVSQQLDRIELNARLYRATSDDVYLRAAQGATVMLTTLLQRLSPLSADPGEARRVADLNAAAAALSTRVDHLQPDSGSVREQVVDCRRILSPMQDQASTLLAEHAEEEQRSDFYAMTRRFAVIVVGAALILVLFGFLARDAVRRARFEGRLSQTNEQLRETVQRLEQQAWESKLLIAARDEVALCLEVIHAEAATVRYLEQLLPGSAGSLCIINHSRQLLESAGSWGSPQAAVFDGFEPESCCGLRSGRARWRRPEESEVHCTHFSGAPPEHYLCLPLIAHGETLGVVYIECPDAGIAALVQSRENTLASLGEMAAMAIAGLNLRQKLENQSIRDGMTGLFNRSFMEIALERELHRAGRQGKQIAVLMLDIDQFKQFNDTFGHEAGDMVLRSVAESLRSGVRTEDIVCRFGGEEFVIILPEITAMAALERSELLRRTVGELALRYHGQPLRQVTISIGFAMSPEHGDTSEDLLRSADRGLYAAKRRGRNRVAQADSSVQV